MCSHLVQIGTAFGDSLKNRLLSYYHMCPSS